MPENQTVLFGGLILGVLRILLFQGRAESPKERLPWASYVIHQILDDFFVLIYVTVTQCKPKESTHNSRQIFSRLEPLQPKFSTACFWCY